MKNIKPYFIYFFLIHTTAFFGQITLNNAGTLITINGNETGDNLRTFIIANPQAGSITNRNITFNASLRVNGNLTDNNAVYHFPESFRFEPRTPAIVTFTDITIHYSGLPKIHSFNSAYTANFTRVFYLQGVTNNRSDFFNNGNYTFNMDNVTFVSYGNSDFIHFQTSETLNNITITNARGNLNFEPGARNNGEVEIINNLKLEGISRIVGGSGANGDFKTFNMDWDATRWNFDQRNVDFMFVDPIKPVGWTGYTGQASRVKEFYTHNVTITNEAFTPQQDIQVLLFNNTTQNIDYNETTNAQGNITQQEILKIDNSVSLNFDRGTSTLVIPTYDKQYYAQIRNFTNPVKDNIILINDTNITETNTTVVNNYPGININHNTQSISINANTNLCQLYDFIKLNKLSNLTQPNLTELLVKPEANNLNIGNYQLILSGNAVLSTCDKFNSISSTNTSLISNNTNLDVGLTDASGTFKLVEITNITMGDVLIRDETTNTTLETNTNFTGTIAFTTQDTNTLSFLVTRDQFSPWSTSVDLSTATNTFQFQATQIPLPNLGTTENQESILYLLQKILQKEESILSSINSTNSTTITVNNINSNATITATEERQTEMLLLLKRILAKTSASREAINSN